MKIKNNFKFNVRIWFEYSFDSAIASKKWSKLNRIKKYRYFWNHHRKPRMRRHFIIQMKINIFSGYLKSINNAPDIEKTTCIWWKKDLETNKVQKNAVIHSFRAWNTSMSCKSWGWGGNAKSCIPCLHRIILLCRRMRKNPSNLYSVTHPCHHVSVSRVETPLQDSQPTRVCDPYVFPSRVRYSTSYYKLLYSYCVQKDVLRLSREQAAEFYRDHESELYFPRLVDHMSGGPIAVYVLAKRDCVDEWRRLIGPADVCSAKRCFPVSLRAVYGTESTEAPVANAFHGSDSRAAAKREIRFFFPNSKLLQYLPT